MYIDEDSNYHLREIKKIKYRVADLIIDEKEWDKKTIKGSTILFDKTTELGLLTFQDNLRELG